MARHLKVTIVVGEKDEPHTLAAYVLDHIEKKFEVKED